MVYDVFFAGAYHYATYFYELSSKLIQASKTKISDFLSKP